MFFSKSISLKIMLPRFFNVKEHTKTSFHSYMYNIPLFILHFVCPFTYWQITWIVLAQCIINNVDAEICVWLLFRCACLFCRCTSVGSELLDHLVTLTFDEVCHLILNFTTLHSHLKYMRVLIFSHLCQCSLLCPFYDDHPSGVKGMSLWVWFVCLLNSDTTYLFMCTLAIFRFS